MLKKLSKSLWEVLIMYKIMYKVYKKDNIFTSAYGQDRTPSRRGAPSPPWTQDIKNKKDKKFRHEYLANFHRHS